MSDSTLTRESVTLESILTEFSALLNCNIEQGCKLAAQPDCLSIQIEFGIRDPQTEAYVCLVPVHVLYIPDKKLIEKCDTRAAVEVLNALGLDAEFGSGFIMVEYEGDKFQISLSGI